MFSSLIEVTALFNETQVFMYDNSNFIINPLFTIIYIQRVLNKKPSLSQGLPIYISLSHDYIFILIGYFLMGTSIMYANFIVMCIVTYITLSWLYMNMKQLIFLFTCIFALKGPFYYQNFTEVQICHLAFSYLYYKMSHIFII